MEKDKLTIALNRIHAQPESVDDGRRGPIIEPDPDPDTGLDPDWIEKKCKDCQKIVKDALSCVNWEECERACRANLPSGSLGGCTFEDRHSKDLCKRATAAYSCWTNLRHCKRTWQEACPRSCVPHQNMCKKTAPPGSLETCEECIQNPQDPLPDEYQPGGAFGCSLQNYCCTMKLGPSGGKVASCLSFMAQKGCCTPEEKDPGSIYSR